MRSLPVLSLVFATLAALMPARVIAAPQIIAAVPTNGAIEMVCQGGVCRAELSTICLQKHRATPTPGTAYRAYGDAIALTGIKADGSTLALPLVGLNVTSRRAQIAAEFSVSQDLLRRHGAVAVRLDVRRLAMLTPAPVAADSDPQTLEDLERAALEIDRVGARWSELNGERIAAARITNRVVNGLPVLGTVPGRRVEMLWEKASLQETQVSAKTLAHTRDLIGHCQERSAFAGHVSMRRCLGLIHDQYMRGLNFKYWDSLKPGS